MVRNRDLLSDDDDDDDEDEDNSNGEDNPSKDNHRKDNNNKYSYNKDNHNTDFLYYIDSLVPDNLSPCLIDCPFGVWWYYKRGYFKSLQLNPDFLNVDCLAPSRFLG